MPIALECRDSAGRRAVQDDENLITAPGAFSDGAVGRACPSETSFSPSRHDVAGMCGYCRCERHGPVICWLPNRVPRSYGVTQVGSHPSADSLITDECLSSDLLQAENLSVIIYWGVVDGRRFLHVVI